VHEGAPDRADDEASIAFGAGEIADQVASQDIDILCLQEVDFDADNFHSRILDRLAQDTDLTHTARFALSSSSFSESRRSGVAIASRYPVQETTRQPLRNPRLRTTLRDGRRIGSFDKGMLGVTLDLGHGCSVVVVSLHMFPFHLFGRSAEDTSFARLWKDAAAWLDGLPAPLIVCGDFNTGNRDLVAGTLRNAVTAPTYRDQAYDDILHSPDLRAEGLTVLDTFSDHRLCVAELVKP
jgi:endonuclease/exonuclease/phosphatase family metal-dependent hydrolase